MTYSQAKAANWPRNTCIDCQVPCAYDREYKAMKLCQSCAKEGFPNYIIQRKELLPCQSLSISDKAER